MHIRNSSPAITSHINNYSSKSTKEAPSAQPAQDTFTSTKTKDGIDPVLAGNGAAPPVDAGTNAPIVWIRDTSNIPKGLLPFLGFMGVATNVSGCAVGAYGLCTSNVTAAAAGLGLLGASILFCRAYNGD